MRTTSFAAALMALVLTVAFAGTAEARDGCGLGFHRGFYGYCRPNVGYRPFYPGFGYGHHRFGWSGPRWHRW